MGNSQTKKEDIPETAPNFSSSLEKFETNARVVRIVDGDTFEAIFKLNDEYLKFMCNLEVNAPELRGGTEETKNDAKESKKFLQDLVLNKIVYLKCKKFDYLGRIIVEMFINEKNVSEILVENGFAE